MKTLKEHYSELLKEAASQKIQVLEKTQQLSNFQKVAIQKREGLFDWNTILKTPEKSIEEFMRDVWKQIADIIAKASPSIQPFLKEAHNYFKNNNYEPAFQLLFLSDISNKYANTRDAVPTFETFIVGDLYQSLKNKQNFGNLAKLYQETAKAQIQETGQGQPNSWIVISGDTGLEEFEKNIKKLMALSSAKTGWCVRGDGMARRYLEYSDFHLYLDKDGDAVVSLRMSEGGQYVEEISGTENGDQQHVAEQYIPVVKEYFKTNNLKFNNPLEFDFRPTELVELLRGERNYDLFIENVLYGDISDREWYSPTFTEFVEEYFDEEKLIKAYAEDTEDEQDLERKVSEVSEEIEELLRNYYDDFSVDRVYSRMYEDTAIMQMAKDLEEKAQELFDSGQMEFVNPEDTQSILFRTVKPKPQTSESEIDRFFEAGQPQVQNGEATDISSYIEENMTDIEEPYYGYGEFDEKVLEDILFDEHMDMMKDFGDESVQNKIQEINKKREENLKQRQQANESFSPKTQSVIESILKSIV